ncbi:MAG: hypothetical protein LAQ69_24700 [Acidobacteriia bacterium]|nr:hypothetical protein [Terriglobia bacterium]
MIHKAKELSAEQRLAIESLLGRAIAEQEEISIRTLPETLPVSAERRRAIIEELRKHFAAVDAQRQPVSPQEADEIINEALRSTRPNYRPVH